ncbi:MAG: hypothetical protein NTV52_02415 [Acidobacteria bacterium]|nr:hypothetical protein [Acidobacteriota bacterium]
MGTPAPPLSPGDTVRSLGPGVVTFRTPPGAEGLGTSRRLRANDDAIRGVVVVVGKDHDLVFLCLRLGRGMEDREETILRDVAGRSWEGAL